jgi:hypothetical protein
VKQDTGRQKTHCNFIGSWIRKGSEPVMMFFWVLAPCILVSLHLQGWRWRQYVSQKRWHLHGAKTQNNIIFIIAAAKTKNLRQEPLFIKTSLHIRVIVRYTRTNPDINKDKYLKIRGIYKLYIIGYCLWLCVCCARLTNFSVMTLDDRMFYFTSATTIRQFSEILIRIKRQWKKVVRDEDTKEIISYWISASHFH